MISNQVVLYQPANYILYSIISVLQIPLFACLLNCPADGLSMTNCAAAGRIFRPGRFQPQIFLQVCPLIIASSGSTRASIILI